MFWFLWSHKLRHTICGPSAFARWSPSVYFLGTSFTPLEGLLLVSVELVSGSHLPSQYPFLVPNKEQVLRIAFLSLSLLHIMDQADHRAIKTS